MDTISIQKIRAYGYIGVLPEEQILGQWFEVNLQLQTDLTLAGTNDNLEETIDYRTAIAMVKQIITTEKFALVERLAQAIADQILTLDRIFSVQVQVIKWPPIPNFDGQIIIEIERTKIKDCTE